MRVLMLDDHLMFLQGLKTLLNTLAPEMRCDISAGMNDGLQMAAASSYELILLDWYLGEGAARTTGEVNIQRLREAGCTARFVVLTGQTDSSLIRHAIKAGAVGFIPKKYGAEIMLAALRVVVSGGVFLPAEAIYERGASQVGGSLAGRNAGSGAAKSVRLAPPPNVPHQPQHARRASDALVNIESRFANLTTRQVEVYRAVARGLPNKLIARELGITESTVKTHLSAVYAVLGVSNRTQAAFQAAREGFRVS